MKLKNYNPKTPSLRELVQIDRSSLWKGKPHKSLAKGLSKSGGRNNLGRTTAWHRGGGHKKLYREIDFRRNKRDIVGVVERIEYDPNRTSFIALIKYNDGEYNYILAPQNLNIGDEIISSENADIKIGNCLSLKNIPIGTIIHNLEMKPGKGGQLARSAGSSISLMGKDSGYAQIKLRSGEVRIIPIDCLATIGTVSNADHQNTNLGKAGRNRWKGWRPHV